MAWFKSLSKGKKALVITGAALLLLLVLTWILVPVIVRGMAPGVIEKQFAQQFQGTAKVGTVRIGWGSPIVVESIEILDDQGKPVGTASATIPMGIWGAITGQRDLRTITLKLDLALTDTIDATGKRSSNLARALAPRTTTPKDPNKPATLPTGYTIAFELQPSRITYTETAAAPGGASRTSSITDLTATGEASTVGPASLKASLKGNVAGAGSAPGTISADISGSNLTDANGALQTDTATIDLKAAARRAPVALIDAMLALDGALLGALGETADADIVALGSLKKATTTITLASPNTTADLALAIDNGRLSASRPGTVRMASTEFLTRLPATRDALARAGIQLERAPNLDVTINALAASTDAGADLRGASMDVALHTGPATLTVPNKRDAAARSTIALSELNARLQSPNLADGLVITAVSSAAYDGRSAGNINVQLSLKEILDANGRWRAGLPGSIGGTAEARGISADLLAPFLVALDMPLDPATDIGPTLDASLTARDAGGGATDIDASVASANVRFDSAWRLTRDRLETRERGLTASIGATTPLVQRILAKSPNPPMSIEGPGQLNVTSTRLFIPLAEGRPSGAPPQGDLRLAYSRVTLTPARAVGSAAPQPIAVEGLTADVTIAPGSPLQARLDGRMSHGGRPIGLNGNLAVSGLESAGTAAPIGGFGARRLNGELRIVDLPAALLDALGAADGNLIAGIVGDKLNVALTFRGTEAAQALDAVATSTTLNAGANIEIAKALTISKADLQSTMSAESARALLMAFGVEPDSLRDVRLPATSRFTASLKPVTIPLKAGTLEPDAAAAGDAVIAGTMGLDQPLIIENVRMGQNVISGGVANLAGQGSIPVAALAKGGTSKSPITGSITGAVVRAREGRLDEVAALAGDFSMVKDGPLTGKLELRNLRSVLADEMLGRPGYISGAVGETANFAVRANRPAGGQTTTITMELDSKQLIAKGWRLELTETQARIAGPATAEWRVEPEWANRYILSRAADRQPQTTPGGRPRRYREDPTATMTLTGPMVASLTVQELVVAMPGEGNPDGLFKPGVFRVNAAAAIPQAAVTWQEVVRTDEGPKGTFNPIAALQRAAAGGEPAAPPMVRRTGVVRDVRLDMTSGNDGTLRVNAKVAKVSADTFDADGNVAADVRIARFGSDNQSITGDIELVAFPTAILDGFLRQRGLLRDGLGPAVDAASIKLANFSTNSGSLTAGLDSQRASLSIAGNVVNGALQVSGTTPKPPPSGKSPTPKGPVPAGDTAAGLRIELIELSETLGKRVMRPIFNISSVYKTREDSPGLITSRDLAVPLDGDMAKTQGALRVDLGTARFTVNNTLFSGILKAVDQKVEGSVGRRMEPFDIRIDRGVARFENVKVPLGEFNCDSSGVVDLVNETVDVVLWVPATQVADEVLGAVGGGGLGQITNRILPSQVTAEMMFPFRIRGPMDNPGKPQPDGKLFLERNVLKQPERILDVLPIPNPFKKGK